MSKQRKVGAEGRTRTDMVLPPVDFESTAYTNFATSAGSWRGSCRELRLLRGSSGRGSRPRIRVSGVARGRSAQYSRSVRWGKIERVLELPAHRAGCVTPHSQPHGLLNLARGGWVSLPHVAP